MIQHHHRQLQLVEAHHQKGVGVAFQAMAEQRVLHGYRSLNTW
jgi:hypothetical protein